MTVFVALKDDPVERCERGTGGRRAPQQNSPEKERYLVQIDRQTKRSFKTFETARSAALEIKARFPALQVSIYDSASKSRTLVDVSHQSSSLG